MGHFVSSPREREEIEEVVGDEREDRGEGKLMSEQKK